MIIDANDWVGGTETVHDILTRSLIDRYRATVGGLENHEVAPLGLHWCLGTPNTPVQELGLDGHPKKGGFLPPISLPRRMWASSHVCFRAPLQIGSPFQRHSSVEKIVPKSGSSGELVFVTVKHVISSGDEECIRERQTIVYREASPEMQALPTDANFEKPDSAHQFTVTPSTQLLFRYSALTFNSHRIHYDAEYAALESYPALVVHGPLMASLLLRLASNVLGEGAIESFEFRGHSPAYCGQDILFCFGFLDDPERMEVRGNDGRLVMSARVKKR